MEGRLLCALGGRSGLFGDVEAVLHFYKAPSDGSCPKFVVTHPSGAGEKNYGHDPKTVLIRDIRGQEDQFTLSRHSFTTVSSVPTAHMDFGNIDNIHEQYEPLIEAVVLQNIPEASKIVVFDITIRRAEKTEERSRPVRNVHIDQSPGGAWDRTQGHLAQREADQVLRGKSRLRIVNVWKPLVDVVADHPLALAESTTVREEDLVRLSHIYPDVVGETYAVKFRPEQRFWYWSNMTRDEVLLFQCFDSLGPVGASQVHGARCAHASFTLQAAELEGSSRESIEARCLVLG
ncbi:hypothetical protein MMC18_005009 [Xylographa bjoerkii]|nr:hypothetical protein [Xylographa bjoerkii]